MKKTRKNIVLLITGVIFVFFPFAVRGPSILYSTAEHIYNDLTVDLIPHILILGVLMILYAFYRMGK